MTFGQVTELKCIEKYWKRSVTCFSSSQCNLCMQIYWAYEKIAIERIPYFLTYFNNFQCFKTNVNHFQYFSIFLNQNMSIITQLFWIENFWKLFSVMICLATVRQHSGTHLFQHFVPVLQSVDIFHVGTCWICTNVFVSFRFEQLVIIL